MMNKKGATLLVILFAAFYFMVGMIAFQLIMPDITTQRDAAHLNCASPSTDGDKLSCLFVGGVIPVLILAILSTTGGIVTDKVIR